MGEGMQRQITPLAALPDTLRCGTPLRVPEILDLELAQFLSPQLMEKQRRKNGAIAL
jgi:hypothetical protein